MATIYNEAANGDLSNSGSTPTQLGSLAIGDNTLNATFKRGTNPDPDYFSFTIPEGQVLTEIRLNSWNTSPNFEDIAFIAIEEGATFDFNFANTNNPNPAAGLLGWSHLRSTQVGTNKILTEMANSNLDPFTSGLNIVANLEADNNPYTPEQLANLPSGVTENALKTGLRNVGTIGTTGSTIGWFPGASGFELPLGPGTYSIWLRQGTDTSISVSLDLKSEVIPEPKPVYRLYNAQTQDHFYTAYLQEAINAVNLDYTFEGVAFDGYSSGLPVYRAYNRQDKTHFYTLDAQELQNAVQNLGYRDEGVEFYAPDTSTGLFNQDDLINVARLSNVSRNTHLYTFDAAESQNAQQNLGYVLENSDFWQTTDTLTYSFKGLDYIAGYSDLIQALGSNIEAAQNHYLNLGITEGRSADNFDEQAYLAANPDIATNPYFSQNAAEHYIRFGFRENRPLG